MNSEQLQELIRETLIDILDRKPNPPDFPELLRTSEVKRFLKIGESSLAGLRLNGTIPFTKIGGSIYYFKKDIIKIVNDNYSGTHEL